MVMPFDDFRTEVWKRADTWGIVWEIFIAFMVGFMPWAHRSYQRGGLDMPELSDIVIAAVTFALLEGGRRWRGHMRASYDVYREAAERIVVLEATEANRVQQKDRDLLNELVSQREKGINDVRAQADDVKDWATLAEFQRSAGRWFGHTEYLAEQLRHLFPTEVTRFKSHGAILTVTNFHNEVSFMTNHLREHIQKKIERLDELIAVFQAHIHAGVRQ
jgi:hypothetical protein